MTLTRSAFVAAFLLICVGALGVRAAVAPLFSRGTAAPHSVVAARNAPKPTPHVIIISPRHPSPGPVRRAHPSRPARVALRPTATATARPTVTPRPSPTASSGVLALDRYWIGSFTARPGQTIEIGYVIDNGTGHVSRDMLGVSLKPNRDLSWAGNTISDPSHDVVATIAPGVSTHIRFFTLPAGLRSGTYDVAWGLRNAASGARQGLVFAPAALRVRG